VEQNRSNSSQTRLPPSTAVAPTARSSRCDGTKPTFPVFSERPDVARPSRGQHGRHRHDEDDREIYVSLGNTSPNLISHGRLERRVDSRDEVITLRSVPAKRVANDVVKPAPRNSNCRNDQTAPKQQTIIQETIMASEPQS